MESCNSEENSKILCFLKDLTIDEPNTLKSLIHDLALLRQSPNFSKIELNNEHYGDFIDLRAHISEEKDQLLSKYRVESPLESLASRFLDYKFEIRNTIRRITEGIKDSDEIMNYKNITSELKGLEFKLKSLDKRIVFPHKEPKDSVSESNYFSTLPDLEEMEKELMVSLDKELTNLSVSSSDSHSPKRLLEIYGALNQMSHAETYLSQILVIPFLEGILTESSLIRLSFSEILVIVFEWLTMQRKWIVIQQISGFEFFRRVFWPQFLKSLNPLLPSILSSENSFSKHFSTLKSFLEKINEKIFFIWQYSSVTDLLRQWNLETYFTVSFNEIGILFESSLKNFFKRSDNSKTRLFVSYTLLDCLWKAGEMKEKEERKLIELSTQILARFTFEIDRQFDTESLYCDSWLLLWLDLRDLLYSHFPILFSKTFPPLFVESNFPQSSFHELQIRHNDIMEIKIIEFLRKESKKYFRDSLNMSRLYRRMNHETLSAVLNGIHSSLVSLKGFFMNYEGHLTQSLQSQLNCLLLSSLSILFVDFILGPGVGTVVSMLKLKETYRDSEKARDQKKLRTTTTQFLVEILETETRWNQMKFMIEDEELGTFLYNTAASVSRFF